MLIASWNVNSIRSRLSQVTKWLEDKQPEVLCLQETKVSDKDFPYKSFENIGYSVKFYGQKSYNGVAIISKDKIVDIRYGFAGELNQLEIPEELHFQKRILSGLINGIRIVNVYVPNSQKLDSDRFKFRKQWNNKFRSYVSEFKREGKNIIICGDMNVAHLEIDISNPKLKKNKVAGFFDFERQDFTFMIESLNLIDVFRNLNPTKQRSTYWSNFLKAKRNISNGWGIDYFLVSKELFESDKNINQTIENEILGSDHCPIILNINV